MKSKIYLLVTLFLVLTIQQNWAQSKNSSNQSTTENYGIDSGKLYKGSDVLKLIELTKQTSEAAIDRSFDEGYKKGLEESAVWQLKAENLEIQLQKEKREKWIFGACGLGGGLLVSGGIYLGIRATN